MGLKLRLKRLFVLCFAIFSVSVHGEYPFGDLADTYSILKKEHQHLSPMFGFVWYKRGILANYYLHGNDEDATIKLIRKLFYIIGDHVELNVTNKRSNVARYLRPNIIGSIFAAIESDQFKQAPDNQAKVDLLVYTLKKEQQPLGQAINTTAFRNQVKTMTKNIKPMFEKNIKKDAFVNFLLTTTNEKELRRWKQKPYFAQLQETEVQEEDRRSLVEVPEADVTQWFVQQKRPIKELIQRQISTRVKSMTEKLQSDTLEVKFKKFAQLIVDSLQETDPLLPDVKYLPFTTHTILLTYLYAKAQDRQEMKGYFDALADFLKEDAVFNVEQASYGIQTYETFRDDSAQWLKNEEEVVLFFENDDRFEKAIFSGVAGPMYERRFAEITNDYGASEYTFDNKSHRFTNCAENSLRNFFNIVLKKSGDITFDLSLLTQSGKVNLKDNAKAEKFRQFYEDFKTIDFIDASSAHNAWNQIVDGIASVGYVIRPDSSRNEKVPSYPTAEDDGHAEIEPSIPHFINIFRHLFAMPAFESYLTDNTITIDNNTIKRDGNLLDRQETIPVFKQLLEQFSRDDLTIEVDLGESEKEIITVHLQDTIADKEYTFDWDINPDHSEIEWQLASFQKASKIYKWQQKMLKAVLKIGNDLFEKDYEQLSAESAKLHQFLTFVTAYHKRDTIKYMVRKFSRLNLPTQNYQWLSAYILFLDPISSQRKLLKKKNKLIKYILKKGDDAWVVAHRDWIISFVKEIFQGVYGAASNEEMIFAGTIIKRLIDTTGFAVTKDVEKEIIEIFEIVQTSPRFVGIITDIARQFLEVEGNKLLVNLPQVFERFAIKVAETDGFSFAQLMKFIVQADGKQWILDRGVWLLSTVTFMINVQMGVDEAEARAQFFSLYKILGKDLLIDILNRVMEKDPDAVSSFIALMLQVGGKSILEDNIEQFKDIMSTISGVEL